MTREGASNIRWQLVGVMCVASFVSYLLRTSPSIVGNAMMSDLKLTQVQLGMIFSAFAWGYGIFQFPTGVFSEIIGSRMAMSIAALLWSVFTIAMALTPSGSFATTQTILISLIVIQFLIGASHAPIYPVVGGTIGNWFPVSRWALPNGLTSTALTLGAAAAAPLLVWLEKISGWRGCFLLTAPLGVIAAFLWWHFVRDHPSQHPGVNQKELDLIDADRPGTLESKSSPPWKAVIKNREVLLLTISYFCMNYVFYLFFNWFFIYLVRVRGVSEQEAGYLTASQWIVGAVGATAGGYLCDRFAKRFGARNGYRLLPIPCLILTSLSLYAGAVVKDAYLAVTLFAFCFGMLQMIDPVYWAAIVSVSGRHASAASGVLNTGGNVVGGIGAIVVPFTAQQFGWVAAMMTGSFFAIVGAILWLMIRTDRPLVVK